MGGIVSFFFPSTFSCTTPHAEMPLFSCTNHHAEMPLLEKKSRPDDGMTLPDKGMTMAILSTLFNKMDLETKKHIRQQGGRDDFLKMKKCVEQLRQMEKSLTNNKVDIGDLADANSHSEFVAWQDAGCPE